MDDSLARGFSTATIVPAIASTFKQAQREAADSLHLLAAYHARANRVDGCNRPPLSQLERDAARRIGLVLVEQGINGTALFLAVKLSVIVGGPLAGMLAQVAITGNTMVTPRQTQAFNPAHRLFQRFDANPDWVEMMDERKLTAFAFYAGAIAAACGYGCQNK